MKKIYIQAFKLKWVKIAERQEKHNYTHGANVIFSVSYNICPELEVYELNVYSMCSLVVSVLDSPAVDPRSNPGSALLMSEKSQAVYHISSCHMLIDKIVRFLFGIKILETNV